MKRTFHEQILIHMIEDIQRVYGKAESYPTVRALASAFDELRAMTATHPEQRAGEEVRR